MEFRPCIDIHSGKVKQIVGGSLKDEDQTHKFSQAAENFVSEMDAAFYANYYKSLGIKGGHVILLNKAGTEDYQLTKKQAINALNAYPKGLQVGGGMNPQNALEFINAGASQVIVTSYVFQNGKIEFQRLNEMVSAVGKEHLVLDLSCRKKDGVYYIVTDRWQKFTDTILTVELLEEMEQYAAEYLIHAVDVEGKASGIDEALAKLLGEYKGLPVTYAGGIHSFDDLRILKELGNNRVNATVGSALDLFGGDMKFEEVLDYCKKSIEIE